MSPAYKVLVGGIKFYPINQLFDVARAKTKGITFKENTVVWKRV
jgi:hypothetical protein